MRTPQSTRSSSKASPAPVRKPKVVYDFYLKEWVEVKAGEDPKEALSIPKEADEANLSQKRLSR